MIFSLDNAEGVTTLRIEGELDAVSVSDIRTTLNQIVDETHKNIVVDLSALRLIDSSGVGAIVSLYKRVRGYGGAVSVRGVRDQPLAIFRLLRLDRILIP